MSIESKILKKINSKERGVIFFTDEFSDISSYEAIRTSLHRIKKKGLVSRVAQGIYVRPKISKHLGIVLPSAEEVAKAIAKRDRIRIVPTGAYALNALGISNQIPMKIVYLTDGPPREIKVGKRSIKLKKSSPKNLSAKGSISGLVIQALKELGKDGVNEKDKKKIINILSKEDKLMLRHDITLAPVWIKEIMKKAI